MIVVFLLTGRYLEARARYRAGDALRSLLNMGAKEATLVNVDPATGERTVPRLLELREAGLIAPMRIGEECRVSPAMLRG